MCLSIRSIKACGPSACFPPTGRPFEICCLLFPSALSSLCSLCTALYLCVLVVASFLCVLGDLRGEAFPPLAADLTDSASSSGASGGAVSENTRCLPGFPGISGNSPLGGLPIRQEFSGFTADFPERFRVKMTAKMHWTRANTKRARPPTTEFSRRPHRFRAVSASSSGRPRPPFPTPWQSLRRPSLRRRQCPQAS